MKYILIILLATLSKITFACDCESKGAFLKVAPTTEFVALVKVTKYLTFKNIYNKQTPISMEVEVIEIYKGTETRKSIIVWGDNGILCRPYLSQFDTDKYYVIAFHKNPENTKGEEIKEKATDYYISSCGDYWLNADIKKQLAIGAVTAQQTQISLTDLKTKIASK